MRDDVVVTFMSHKHDIVGSIPAPAILEAVKKNSKSNIKRRDALSDYTGAEVSGMVSNSALNVERYLKGLRSYDWNPINTPAIMKNVQNEISRLKLEMSSKLNKDVVGMVGISSEATEANLKRIGARIQLRPVPSNLIQNEIFLVGTLISGFVDEQIARASAIVNLGVQGGKSVAQVSEELQALFDMAKVRADRIARTEMLRVHSMTDFSRAEEIQQYIPNMRKVWNSTFKPNAREDHIEAHNRYNENPIPMDEEFEIGGELAMFPRDPKLSVAQSVNCTCYITYVEGKE